MKRVIDSSVSFKWVVPETHSNKALLIRDDFRNGLVELLAPDVFLSRLATPLPARSDRAWSPHRRAAPLPQPLGALTPGLRIEDMNRAARIDLHAGNQLDPQNDAFHRPFKRLEGHLPRPTAPIHAPGQDRLTIGAESH